MRRSDRVLVVRRGVTLVEILVVITIIGVLTMLTVPLTARVVARSRVTSCTNNQYQIAFALMRYDEQNGSVPGWLNHGPDDSSWRCSWPVMLLPFLGRTDIYDMWPELFAAWPRMPNDPTVEVFVCPAYQPSAAELKEIDGANTEARPPSGKNLYPVIHYVGNVGATGTSRNDGIFLNRCLPSAESLSLDQVADGDGTFATLAFSEKKFAIRFMPHTWRYTSGAATPPAGSLFGSGTSSPPAFGAVALPAGLCGQTIRPSQIVNVVATRTFAPSSDHADGAVVAFCDGHTVFVRDDLDAAVYGQLLTPRSRWKTENGKEINRLNTPAMEPWVVVNPTGENPRLCPETINPWIPYLLDEKLIKGMGNR